MVIDFDKLEKVREDYNFNNSYLIEVLEIFKNNENNYIDLLDDLDTYLDGITESAYDEGYENGYQDGLDD